MKTTKTLLACLALTLGSPVALASANFYKWTDEKGVTHYSESPPPESTSNATKVKVPTRLPSGAQAQPTPNAGKADAQKAGDKKGQSADKPAKDSSKETAQTSESKPGAGRYAEKCKELDQYLETMNQHGRIKITEEGGSTRVLSEEEKTAKIDDLQRQRQAFCN
ncbi:MAG: hypothetical protein K0R03_2346 [Moraxellaceae bacterium]|jgi:hypothetical protein|nr:hypothetical protein [Moraxellaceae bacterium]